MASIPGGLLFTPSAGSTTPTHLGFNNGTLNNNGGTVAGALNVEIFTALPLGSPEPALDPGYTVAVNIPNATLTADGHVVGLNVEMYSGDYAVIDQAANGSPNMQIVAGSGNQTIYGATGDTIVGGSGNTVLDATGAISGKSGGESIVGGASTYAIADGAGDTVVGSNFANAGTSGQILASLKDNITLQSAGAVTISGGIGDTISAPSGVSNSKYQIFLAGNSVVNLSGDTATGAIYGDAANGDKLGGDTITAGNGAATIAGTTGDVITGGAGKIAADHIIATDGGMTVNIGGGGSDTVIAGGNDTLVGGGAAVSANLGSFDIVNFAGQTGDATLGLASASTSSDVIILGAGNATVFGAPSDTINLGTGTQQVVGYAGGMSVKVGGGVATLFGSTVSGSADTFAGGGGNVSIQFLGNGDVVNFTAETGNVTIAGNAASGNSLIGLGTGRTDITGATGDTIVGGSGNINLAGGAGGMSLQLNGGADSVVGSSGASGDTITAGSKSAGSLLFNPGTTGGDVVDLTGYGGTALINAFGSATQLGAVNDVVVGSENADTVFGGNGDTIGAANFHVPSLAANKHTWSHQGLATSGEFFGTFDTVTAVTYTGKTATIDTTTGSNAFVTVGGATSGQFVPGVDRIFYQNETTATDAQIVASATSVGKGTSSVIVLPDGTTMTLIGVSATTLVALGKAGTLFG